MITIDNLKEYGANVDEGMARCMGNEALYLRLVTTIPAEANFDKLASSIEARDLDAAFDAAHALKGVTGNLALTPLYQAVFEITELLRAKTDTDYTQLLAEIATLRDKLAQLCTEG